MKTQRFIYVVNYGKADVFAYTSIKIPFLLLTACLGEPGIIFPFGQMFDRKQINSMLREEGFYSFTYFTNRGGVRLAHTFTVLRIPLN